VQRADTAPVLEPEISIQPRRRRRSGRNSRSQFGMPRLQLLKLPLQAGRPPTLADRLDEVANLPLQFPKQALLQAGLRCHLAGQPAPLLREGLCELGGEIRIHKLPCQRAAHPLLERVAPQPGAVRASSLMRGAAGEPGTADALEGPRATAAEHLAGQQVPWPAPLPEPRLPILSARRALLPQAALDGVEQRRIDQPQPRHLLRDHLPLGVRPAQLLARRRILERPPAIPDEASVIKRVAQHAVALARAAPDDVAVPDAAARAGNAFGVERLRDRPRAAAGGILREDAPHDGGLHRIRLAQAAFELAIGANRPANEAVAVDDTADQAAGADPSLHAPARLVGEVAQVERAHGALQADMQLADLALRQRDQPHAGEGRLLVEDGNMLQVAGEAVEALGQHNVQAAGPHGVDEPLVAGPIHRGARDGSVREDPDDLPALPVGADSADPDLVFDRGLALLVRAVAGVDGATHQDDSSTGWIG
jgi:hypothetical protein